MRQQSIKRTARDQVVAAAIRIWAADPSASLERVAAEAGVSRATLHRSFPARADLLRAATLDGLTALDHALTDADLGDGDSDASFARLIELLVRAGDRLHFTLVAAELLDDPVVREVEADIDARLRALLDGAVRAGVLRADTAPAWRFRMIESVVYAAWTAVAAGDVAYNDAPALVRTTILRGIGA